MPAWTTVHDWKQADESFRQALARAREQQAEVWAEEMLSISDDDLPTHEAIGRARLRVQSRQWLAGKYNPQFADKPNQTQVNVGVQVVVPRVASQPLAGVGSALRSRVRETILFQSLTISVGLDGDGLHRERRFTPAGRAT